MIRMKKIRTTDENDHSFLLHNNDDELHDDLYGYLHSALLDHWMRHFVGTAPTGLQLSTTNTSEFHLHSPLLQYLSSHSDRFDHDDRYVRA